MSIKGVDYAWSHPGGAALRGAGVKFACRYLSHDASKTVQRPEADDLAAHGISLAVVYEDTANRAADGHQAGVNDAIAAMKMTKGMTPGYTDLGMPPDRPIYFAVDFDATWAQVSDYLAGAGLSIGKSRVGVYGGLDIITAARNAGYTWLWQASAWSHGQWNPYAQLRQMLGTEHINGVDCDINAAMVADFGQWTPGGDDVTPEQMTAAAQVLLNTAITSKFRKDAKGAPLQIPVREYFDYMDAHYDSLMQQIAALNAQVAALTAALKKP
jgi:hypothetical protein